MKSKVAFATLAGCLLGPAGCAGAGEFQDLSLPVAEVAPGENQLLHYPQDGAQVQVNPPGVTWTRHPEAKEYRLLLFREPDLSRPVVDLAGLSSTVAALSEPLEAGSYSWSVVFEGADGRPFGRSKTRGFSLKADAPLLVMPDVGQLREALKGRHPRLFLTSDRLENVRNAMLEKRIPLWGEFESRLERGLREPLYPEPEPYRDGVFTAPEWRRIYTPAKVGTSHMVRQALAWKLTGKPEYLTASRAWLLHFASWDPRGVASHDVPQPNGEEGNDEASMPMLERMSMVYDWMHEELADEERTRIREVMTERGNQVLAVLKQQDFLSNPFENHEGRVLAFLGLAGLAFIDEIPDAEAWLDYVLRCYLTSFPVWGSDEGEWAQGLSYWSAYVLWLTEFADALRSSTPVDIYRRPFFRNTGYLPVYFLPPYAKRGAFGDGGESGPSYGQKLLIRKFATAFQDPVLLWQADQIPGPLPTAEPGWNEWFMEDIHALLDVGPAGLVPKPPTELPPVRFLPNVGWAAVHSDLGDAADDVWLLFKSSRFGSFSHSHADQNSFQLNAFGEPLLIDSGYYPWYGSPHHTLWARQTRAHNAILVNGRGQPPYDMAARGTIEYCRREGDVTAIRGEAAGAYNLAPSREVIELWEETFGTPHPPSEPEVEVARRTLAFVDSAQGPWIALQDYVRVGNPARFQFLLHALNEMKLNPAAGRIQAWQGEACLDVYLAAETELAFAQTDKFPVAPEERYAGAPDQHHFTAETKADRSEIKFLALMLPYRKGASPPAVSPFQEGELKGFRVGADTVASWWGPGETGKLTGDGKEGRLLVETGPPDRRQVTVCE